MRRWFDQVGKLGMQRGTSFDLDFHTIPFHGEDALIEKHYVSKRSRRQKGLLAFLARDAEARVFCYANGSLRKDEQNDEILRFVDFWKQRTGHFPEELIFDSKLTTYANLNRPNRMLIENAIADGIDFFHMDALSSAVAMKVDCDLQLTLMASSLYRLLGADIGREYAKATSRRIFRDFIDAGATVNIDEKHIYVRFQKRSHNPQLKAAAFENSPIRVPWLANRKLSFLLG